MRLRWGWGKGGLTNSALLVYTPLLSRWHCPSLGMKMPPSFPSPAVWNVSSEVNTRSRDTFLQPICS